MHLEITGHTVILIIFLRQNILILIYPVQHIRHIDLCKLLFDIIRNKFLQIGTDAVMETVSLCFFIKGNQFLLY